MRYVVRLLPVLLLVAAALVYILDVEGDGDYRLRNTVPLLSVVLLASVTLVRGRGHWSGSGWSWPLGMLGFAIPAVGLSIYLHYGYANDLNGMYSEAIFPQELFRYLPFYTMFAGATGFAIGWIIGRNAQASL